ncbi:MAG: hypothetical protein JWQ69_5694 [Pseudomonas sp.]|nr:hypothetical protein [Pseudomonas sp.]
MELVLDLLATVSRWSRSNLSEIALALVGCLLVLFGADIKGWLDARIGSLTGALRVPVLALLCTIGSGAALIYATPWVIRGLSQFNNYSLAPVLLVVLILIGVVADLRRRTWTDRSHAPRGNAARDAPRHNSGRGASIEAFPRGAWERSTLELLELQIPHPMPQPLAAAFELGDRAFSRAWHAFAVFGLVAITRRDIHHFQHVFGIGFPIGRHVQNPADFQLAAHQLGELRLDDAALVMTAFVPGIREEQHQTVKAVVGDATVENFDRVAIVDPHVSQALSQHAIEQRTDTRVMHFDPDEIVLRRSRRHFQQRMAHAETDFQGARRRATEYLIVIHGRIDQRQDKQRPTLIQAALLAFGHTSGAHHETLDAAVLALFTLFRDRCCF